MQETFILHQTALLPRFNMQLGMKQLLKYTQNNLTTKSNSLYLTEQFKINSNQNKL